MIFLKYLFAGGTAGIIQLILLYVFTDLLKIHYLISTTGALFVVFWVSFFLQKYWTFTETSRDRMWRQMGHYLVMHSASFLANAALMYVGVTVLGLWYILSQIIVSLSIAVVTFSINKKFIFKKEYPTSHPM